MRSRVRKTAAIYASLDSPISAWPSARCLKARPAASNPISGVRYQIALLNRSPDKIRAWPEIRPKPNHLTCSHLNERCFPNLYSRVLSRVKPLQNTFRKGICTINYGIKRYTKKSEKPEINDSDQNLEISHAALTLDNQFLSTFLSLHQCFCPF